MSTQQKQPEQPATQLTTAKPTDEVAQYVPFAAQEPIKLSVRIIRDLLCRPTRSGKLCDDKQAMRFLMLCRSRALNPFEGDAFIVGFDTKDGPEFNLITAHQAFLKRAELHPQFDGMLSGVMVGDQTGTVEDREGDFTFDHEILLGAWATVYRKDQTHPARRRLKLSTFNKGHGRWQIDPAGMIVKCAEADALRSAFPTQMAGMYLEEELGPKTVRDIGKAAAPPLGRHSLRGNGQPSQAVPSATDSNGPESPATAASATGPAASTPAQDTRPASPGPAPGGEERTPKPGPFEPEQLAMQDEISRLRDHIGPVSDGATREAVEDEIKGADVSDQWKQTLLMELEARWRHVEAPFRESKGRKAVQK